MQNLDKMAAIDTVRLDSKSKFSFKCHSQIKCFTTCCRGINIILTPYDIIRLKKRVSLTSEEFLAVYTEPQLMEKTDLPVVTMKLLDDEQKSCPFVRDDGCLVYSDRPTTCRYYPLGVASLSHKEGADDNEFYFFVHEPHCKGFEEDRQWQVGGWRKDQGVDLYDEINAEWADLVVRKRSFPHSVKLSSKSKEMFFMASYNIDKFREFIFKSSFLKRYEIDVAATEKIKKDDIQLLQFAMQWLKFVLFKIGDFKLRAGT